MNSSCKFLGRVLKYVCMGLPAAKGADWFSFLLMIIPPFGVSIRKNRVAMHNRPTFPHNTGKGGIMLKVTKREYQSMSKKSSPPSPVVSNCVKAFLVGGLICAVGQVIVSLAVDSGMAITEARTLCSIVLVAASILLTALDLYDSIAQQAGAGTLVPITGFANSIASPAIEFKAEGWIMGLGAKMFIIAGPVLVYGITASAVYGLILWIVGLF